MNSFQLTPVLLNLPRYHEVPFVNTLLALTLLKLLLLSGHPQVKQLLVGLRLCESHV